MAKLTDSELLAIVDSEINNSLGFTGGDLSNQRAENLDYYFGRAMGNEVEGRSSVVSTDVADTIEWILPSLLKIFTSTDKAVVFKPTGVEDEESAQQETDTVNHIFYQENNGFMVLYSLFKDALIQKRGFVKHVWHEEEKVVKESYQGLSENEMAEILSPDNVEVLEHSESVDESGQVVNDLKIRQKKTVGKVLVTEVPPEETLISSDARTIRDSSFFAHRVEKTLTQLIEMGFERKVVESLPTDTESTRYLSDEEQSRNTLDGEQAGSFTNRTIDDSMRRIWLYECYIQVDYDGDGLAELRKVYVGGNEILGHEPVETIPFSSVCPIPVTHRFMGLAVADLIKDIQKIKSTLLRQMLDNIYLQNNTRVVVNSRVNLDDLINNRPGNIIRVDGDIQPGAALKPMETPQLGSTVFSMIEYMDTIRENRTGVTKYNQGLDSNSLNKTASGMAKIMSASQQRIELIAKIFAETGVKDMFLAIHKLLLENQNKELSIKLRGQYVKVNPNEWKERTNMTVSVGLGSGDEQEKMGKVSVLLNAQKELLSAGMGSMVTPTNLYAGLEKLVEALGEKGAERFFTNPKDQPPQPPKENPEAQGKQQELQLKSEIAKADIELKRMKLESDIALETKKIELQMQLEREKAQASIEIQQAQAQANLEISKMNLEMNNRSQ